MSSCRAVPAAACSPSTIPSFSPASRTWRSRLSASPHKAHELVSFLVDVLGVEKVGGALRRNGRLSRFLRGPARARRQDAAAAAARQRRGPRVSSNSTRPRSAAASAALRGQIRRILQRHRSRKSDGHPTTGGRHGARGRPRLPDEHGGQAPARGIGGQGRAMSQRCSPAWRTGRRSERARRRGRDERGRDDAGVQGECP